MLDSGGLGNPGQRDECSCGMGQQDTHYYRVPITQNRLLCVPCSIPGGLDQVHMLVRTLGRIGLIVTGLVIVAVTSAEIR